LYIVRLYKLVEVPAVGSGDEDQEEHEVAGGDGSDGDQNGDGDDEASASEPGDASPSDSDDDSSESESDPDKGKHNKKRQAKHALRGSPPAKRRKSKPSTSVGRETKPAPRKRVGRVHHQILRPEVYTTLRAANSAACDLQRDIMNEQTLPSAGMQEGNAARLRRKLMELVEGGEARYWHDEFAVGLAGAKMEIAVEDVCVSGPRNV
jgi:hypothetical protein